MTPRLVAIGGPLEGQVFELLGERFLIGRQAHCDLQLSRIEISRQHCEILRNEDGRCTVRDLGSRHGTQVNGQKVEEKELLHSDLLALGLSSFLFLKDDSKVPETETGEAESWTQHRELPPTETLHLRLDRSELVVSGPARMARELKSLVRLSQNLHEEYRIAPLAARLLEAALEAIPADRGAVFLREPGLADLQGVALREMSPQDLSRTVEERVVQGGVALCCPRLREDPILASVPSVAGAGALLAAPLLSADQEPLGLLYLDRRSRGFREDQLDFLAAIVEPRLVAV